MRPIRSCEIHQNMSSWWSIVWSIQRAIKGYIIRYLWNNDIF